MRGGSLRGVGGGEGLACGGVAGGTFVRVPEQQGA